MEDNHHQNRTEVFHRRFHKINVKLPFWQRLAPIIGTSLSIG